MTVIFCDLNDDPWLCGRSAVMGVVAMFTLLITVVHITRAFMIKRGFARCSHQMCVLYIACVQSLLGVIYWLFVNEFEIFVSMLYLKFVQFVLILYFFLGLAFSLTKREYLSKFVALPCAGIYVFYLTAILVVAMIGAYPNARSCEDPVWIAFYSSGFFMSVIFIFVAGYVTRILRTKSVSAKFRRKKIIHMWCLVIVNFFSLAVGMGYVIRLALSRPEQDCFDLIGRKPFTAVIYVGVCTIDFFVPIWVICHVFFKYNIRVVKPSVQFPSSHTNHLVPTVGIDPNNDEEFKYGPGGVNVLQIHGQGTGAPYFLMTSDSPQTGLGISYASDRSEGITGHSSVPGPGGSGRFAPPDLRHAHVLGTSIGAHGHQDMVPERDHRNTNSTGE